MARVYRGDLAGRCLHLCTTYQTLKIITHCVYTYLVNRMNTAFILQDAHGPVENICSRQFLTRIHGEWQGGRRWQCSRLLERYG